MQIIHHNGNDYNLPENLMEITLGQRIDFWEKYDKTHEAEIRAIYEKNMPKDGKSEVTELTIEDADRLSVIDIERAINAYSYFGNIQKEIVENEIEFQTVYGYYCEVLQNLITDDIRIPEKREFEWRGEKWSIPKPTLENGDGKSTREVLTSFNILSQTDRMLKEYAIGKVHILLNLCCIWLKKDGDVFTIDSMREDSERYKLFKELPLEIALQVGFFLRYSWSLYMRTLMSSLSKQTVQTE